MLNLIGSRSRRTTARVALVRDMRHSRNAMLSAYDAIETQADIAVELIEHARYAGRRLFPP